jgi:hypothetical protein
MYRMGLYAWYGDRGCMGMHAWYGNVWMILEWVVYAYMVNGEGVVHV